MQQTNFLLRLVCCSVLIPLAAGAQTPPQEDASPRGENGRRSQSSSAHNPFAGLDPRQG